MSDSESDTDRRMDRALASIGPEVPQPSLEAEFRNRLVRLIEVGAVAGAAGDTGNAVASGSPRPDAMRTRRSRSDLGGIAHLAVSTIAAGLLITCVLLWSMMRSLESRSKAAENALNEIADLLLAARKSIEPIPPPDDVSGLRESDLVLVNFHHDMCPVARVTTPRFERMAARHESESARFVSLDLTGSDRRDEAMRLLEELGIQSALSGPPGAETGVVKVVDLASGRVLCSGSGVRAVEQAESLIERVAASSRGL